MEGLSVRLVSASEINKIPPELDQMTEHFLLTKNQALKKLSKRFVRSSSLFCLPINCHKGVVKLLFILPPQYT